MTLPVDPHLYAAFLGLMLVLALTPGPAILFSVATGVRHGKRAMARAAAGMNAANAVWMSAAAFGLAGLAAAFPAAFAVLRWVGVGYLVFLGGKALWSAWRPDEAGDALEAGAARPFRDGFVVQITNPKALLFVTAVLPPFVDPARAVGPQIAAFAAGMISLDVAAMLLYGFSGAALSARMADPKFRSGFSAFTGLLLLAAATMIVLRH